MVIISPDGIKENIYDFNKIRFNIHCLACDLTILDVLDISNDGTVKEKISKTYCYKENEESKNESRNQKYTASKDSINKLIQSINDLIIKGSYREEDYNEFIRVELIYLKEGISYSISNHFKYNNISIVDILNVFVRSNDKELLCFTKENN